MIIRIPPKFFYNVTLPCTLWFFDKKKSLNEGKNKILFIDCAKIYEQIDRAHRVFLPSHIEFIANIVRLYRGINIKTEVSNELLKKFNLLDGYKDILGLCKVAILEEVIEQNYSLNPRRYVGVKLESLNPEENYAILTEYYEELQRLFDDSSKLQLRVSKNLLELLKTLDDQED